jgi:hypothetical protein
MGINNLPLLFVHQDYSAAAGSQDTQRMGIAIQLFLQIFSMSIDLRVGIQASSRIVEIHISLQASAKLSLQQSFRTMDKKHC